MKKLTLLICICFATLAQAQNFRGGAFAGLSLSQIDGDTYSGYTKPGFIVGASVSKALSEDFALAMEFKFIQKGARASSFSDEFGGDDYKVSLNYIQIPLLAKYNVWNNIWMEAGIGFAYLIDYKEERNDNRLKDLPFRKSEFAILAGAAYDIPNTILRVGARFSYSILPVRKIGDAVIYGFFDRSAQYNNNLEFTFGLRFDDIITRKKTKNRI